MTKYLGSALAAALLFAAPSAASAGDLKLTLDSGRVTLIADEVPLRQILAEWARVGKTTIVNGDKLTGPPLTLRLEDVPERQVLDVLLRSASGYIVAARPAVLANASTFDRILIMPTSRPPAVTASAQPPQFNNRPPNPMPLQPDVDDDAPVQEPVIGPSTGMQGQPNPGPGAEMPGQPGAPTTLSRPGMPPAPPAGQQSPYPTVPMPGVRPPRIPGGGGGGE